MEHVLLVRASFEAETVRNFRREVPADVTVVRPNQNRAAVSDVTLSSYDGVIVSGSAASVNDDVPWIDDVGRLVRTAVDLEVPVLGVCWGHQLVAASLGGVVEQRPERELGYVTVRRVEDHPLFHGIDTSFTAFQSHTDYVTRLPVGATLLAESDAAVQSFAYETAMGVQFHPEVDYRTATSLVNRYRDERTTPTEPDMSLRSWALAEEASDVLRNFVYEF